MISVRIPPKSELQRTYEDYDVINPVNKLWGEMSLDSTQNKGSRFRSDGTISHVIEVSGTQIRSHHDDCVSHVHYSALPVCQAAVIQYLQEQSDKFPASLLDFVNEDD